MFVNYSCIYLQDDKLYYWDQEPRIKSILVSRAEEKWWNKSETKILSWNNRIKHVCREISFARNRQIFSNGITILFLTKALN